MIRISVINGNFQYRVGRIKISRPIVPLISNVTAKEDSFCKYARIYRITS